VPQGTEIQEARVASEARRAAQLLAPENPALTHLIAEYARGHRTDQRIAASQLFKAYACALATPFITSWLTEPALLDLSAEQTEVALHATKPYVTLEMSALTRLEASTPTSPEALSLGLDRLLRGHLALAVEEFHRRGGIGARVLWGSVATALTQPFGPLETRLARDLSPEITLLLQQLGPIGALVQMSSVRVQRDEGEVIEARPLRLTCCQKMRIPDATNCTHCPLLSPERRTAISARKNLVWLPNPIPQATPSA
jgi:siderophore-iron reductase FhuF